MLGAAFAQSPPNPVPATEAFPTGALIIPMDNVNQGNAAGTTFNLRAYGLANRLLHGNIPVKWAIRPNKFKDDIDFSANVARIAGGAGVAGPAIVGFSGGAFIVAREYNSQGVLDIISSFNSVGVPVTVYETQDPMSADIRYTLNHKPKIAIGPDGGNFGLSVHQNLLTAAGITSFAPVTDDLIQPNSCYTLATQAHSTNSDFVGAYRQFVGDGGNLLLQCASIDTFENHPAGQFQTITPGYAVFGTNAPSNSVDTELSFPDGAMPFNQFIGALANQDGLITEYAYAPGGGLNYNNRVSATNTGADADKLVATVSQVNGTSVGGGTVFELGGHDYSRTDSGATEIQRLNGQRMILNAVFVPVARPAECGFLMPSVNGYKSVEMVTPDRVGGPPVVAGDILEWTVRYINESDVDVHNFQISDVISEINGLSTGNLTYMPDSLEVTAFTNATASKNLSYTGVGAGSSSDMLAPDAFLPIGGRVRVRVRTRIHLTDSNGIALADGTQVFNQTIASGTAVIETVKSDAIDTDTLIAFTGDPIAVNSIGQAQNVGIPDPTIAIITGPTAANASVDGAVLSNSGRGLKGVSVTLNKAATSQPRSAITNSFGYYRFEDVTVGSLYILSIRNKRYFFENPTYSFTLSDNLTATAFVGVLQ